MNIISVVYLLFILLVVVAYFLAPRKLRWVILLLSSLAYYMIYDLKLSSLLFISSFIGSP